MSDNYQRDLRIKNMALIKAQLLKLPPFAAEFIRGIEDRTSTYTRFGYVLDFSVFFKFLTQQVPEFMEKVVTELDYSDLEKITADDIEDYMNYLTYYIKVEKTDNGEVSETERENEARGKSRKLSALRSMYKYLIKKKKITTNPTDLVDMPKLKGKAIIRLEPDEVARLLDDAESGEKLTKKQSDFHKITKKRDLALLMLLLGTGMRVSECIGLNVGHLDFEINGVKVTRKGGNEAVLYFNDEVREALLDYLEEREETQTEPGHENALFLSTQKKRISVRAVQNLVKKYTAGSTLKNITPHKLRSTFGTNLYNETSDIYLVASALGHVSIDTTRKHYVPMDESRRREAAKYVNLRGEKKNEN